MRKEDQSPNKPNDLGKNLRRGQGKTKAHGLKEGWTERQTNICTDRQTFMQTEGQTFIETDILTDDHFYRQTHTHLCI